MVATNANWAPSTSTAESKGNTPATPTTPEKAFTGKPEGVKWEASKESPLPKAEPVTAADAPEEMTPTQKKIWAIKVNGKERQFDASDENELRRLVEKAYGADAAFEKSAQVSKQAEQFFSGLKEAAQDPRKLAQLLKREELGGVDFRTLAEKFVYEQMMEDSLTPEQREERRVKDELKRYKDQEAADKAKRDSEEQEKVVGHIQESFSKGIDAAHKEAGLNTNPQSIYRMAEYARDGIDQGVEPDFRAIAARVKRDYVEDFAHYFENAEPEQLKDIASEAVLKKLRKMDLDRLKSTTAEQFKAPARAKTAPKRKEDPNAGKLSGSEWREKLIRERG